MLSITAVSAGAVDYLLRGSGCAVHDHDSVGAEAEAASGSAPGERAAGVEYLLGGECGPAEEGPALGVWFGAGLEMVGIAAGTGAREDDVRAVFGQLRHPESSAEDPVFLGRPPRSFRSVEARIAAACAAEPDADPERRAEIASAVRADRRKAVAYYDLTFSPAKSVSVYWAALVAAGMGDEAALVVRAHTDAIAEAMAWAEKEVAWTRAGYHGRTASGRSVGRYESGEGLVWTRWDHWTNRACEPQLHAHVAVLNRTVTCGDGVVRALDGRGFRAVKHGIDAMYARGLERRLGESCGVVFAERPDGKAREILGIDPVLLREASSRRAAVVDHLTGLVADYRRRHGHDPGPAARTRLARAAALATRDAKSHLPVAVQMQAWCAPRLGRLRQALTQAHVAADTHRDQRNRPGAAPDEVLVAAVEEVQGRHATWDVGLLMAAIGDQLARTVGAAELAQSLPNLAERVLAAPARFGIVQVSAPEPALLPIPASLRRPGGGSVLRPHRDHRYTTLEQLSTENGIVALAGAPGAPALDAAAVTRARAVCDSAGLGACQADAVIGILSSGRVGDVLVGPAGVGKSRTLGVLAQAWREHVGGRVLGMATSQIATLELIDNGLEALNTTQFLLRTTGRDQRIRAGDLVVVDEVGMTATAELAEITTVVARAGGKLVFCGDPEQLAAIDAGGMLGLLAADNGYHQLVEVHRFDHAWEKAASLRLREGDPAVLEVYEQHGRIVGGDIVEVAERAMRAYLADTLAGKSSLLVVSSNAEAAELSARIHAELVRLGRVGAQVLCVGGDGNPIGVGDLVQARRNDHTIGIGAGTDAGAVTNRELYRVTGHAPAGLLVRDPHGRTGVLPREYVARHATLGYAATVWAAQGRTVEHCHAVITTATGRRGAYVALSRGRQANTAYVVCTRQGDEHQHEPLASTARAELAAVLTRTDEDTTHTAEQARRTGIAQAHSLAWILGQADLLAGEACAQATSQALHALLPTSTTRALLGEPGYRRLCRAVRAAEIAGHDPTALLTEVVGQRPLFGAKSISDVLRWRIHTLQPTRTPERHPEAGWMAHTSRPGPVGGYLDALADAAVASRIELGEQALREQPEWATHHLGPAPTQPGEREEWARRAAAIGAYRDLATLPGTAVSLGPPPSREQPLHRILWHEAITASGAPADSLDYTTATTTQLRAMRWVYQQQLTIAPPYVHDELRDARLVATGYQTDAILWRAEAQLLALGTPERARADADTRAAEHLAGVYATRADRLAATAQARQRWHTSTQTDRMRFELAGDELTRRGLSRHQTPIEAEELALVAPDLTPGTSTDPARFDLSRGPAASQVDQQLLFEGPSSEPGQSVAARHHRHHPGVAVADSERRASVGQAGTAVDVWTGLRDRVHEWFTTASTDDRGVDHLGDSFRRRAWRHHRDFEQDLTAERSDDLDSGIGD